MRARSSLRGPPLEEQANDATLQVEQSVEANGPPKPLAFQWQGRRWPVNSIGRIWDVNGERHYLVMVPGDRVFELAFSTDAATWRLARRPEDFGPKRRAI